MAAGLAVLLGERDERLYDAAKLFRLRQRGADGLVTQERNAHVPQHRVPVRAVT
jgi:hypothetical protein